MPASGGRLLHQRPLHLFPGIVGKMERRRASRRSTPCGRARAAILRSPSRPLREAQAAAKRNAGPPSHRGKTSRSRRAAYPLATALHFPKDSAQLGPSRNAHRHGWADADIATVSSTTTSWPARRQSRPVRDTSWKFLPSKRLPLWKEDDKAMVCSVASRRPRAWRSLRSMLRLIGPRTSAATAASGGYTGRSGNGGIEGELGQLPGWGSAAARRLSVGRDLRW